MKKELVSRSAEMIRCPATQSPNVFSFFSGPPVALFTLFYIFPSFLQINFRFCFSSCLAFPTFNFFRCLSSLFSSICLSVHRCSLIRYSSRPTFPSCPHLHTFNFSTSLVSARYFQFLFFSICLCFSEYFHFFLLCLWIPPISFTFPIGSPLRLP